MILALTSHLHILQLEGYSVPRFLRWWAQHPFSLQTTQKKPLVWTFKAKLLRLATWGISFFVLVLALLFTPWQVFALAFLLVTLTPLSLITSALLLSIPENWKKQRLIRQSTDAIKQASDLTVVGITGSYGKTSSKEFLYQLLQHSRETVRTPESYNTPLGIARTIQLELTSKVRFFLCEMGAYKRGEIAALTRQVPLEYALLTAIGNQHLERFGSQENITLGKFEIIQAVKPTNALVNLDNELIRHHLAAHPEYQQVNTYSVQDPSATFFATDIQLHTTGASFSLRTPRGTHSFTTSLFGTANLTNLVASLSMAFLLGVPVEELQKAVRKLRPAPHRLELKKIGSATLIDNAFSSNQAGFQLVMEDLARLPGEKALITPGIIELGSATKAIHFHLGEQAAGVFDRIFLVGSSERTKSFYQGVKSVKTSLPIQFLQSDAHLWPLIDQLAIDHQWILLENDLPDTY